MLALHLTSAYGTARLGLPAARVAALGVALGIVFAGCAAIEFSASPPAPDIKVKPRPGEIKHVSPPPLATTETKPIEESPMEVPGDALNLTIEGAIVLAIENNRALDVEKINPAVQQTFVAEQRSVFDPVLVGSYARTEDNLTRDLLIKAPITIPSLSGQTAQTINVWQPVQTEVDVTVEDRSAGITQRLPTGTDVSVTVGKTRSETRNKSTNPDLAYGTDTNVETSNLNFTITQSLLRGGWIGVNLASLRQSRLDTLSSDYELRGFVENLVSQVEQTYWDCVLAQRRIAIFEESLKVAQAQADEVEERIRIGKLAENERAAAQAEVAQRRSSLIDARSNYDTLRIALLRLINPYDDSLRPVDIILQSEPSKPDIRMDHVDQSIKLAQRMRPELNQARLQIKRDNLEVVRTKNGLLPQLDVFLSISSDLTRTQYTEAYLTSAQDRRDDGYTTQVGADFSYPIGNRAARARDSRAAMNRVRSRRALANLEQLVEQDIRTAYVEIGRSREQIDATTATRFLQEQTLAAEIEKFRLGRSTVLLVSQAQRDLLSAQISQIEAAAAYLKAIVNLYRLEGSLLERRGVLCPGRDPVQIEENVSALWRARDDTDTEMIDETGGATP